MSGANLTVKSSRRITVLAVGALLLLVCRAWAGPASGVGDGADAGFRQMVARFIDSEMRLSPVRATEDGDHRFDDRLSDYSHSGIRARIRQAREWKSRFSGLRGRLSAPNEADREWLIAQLDGDLLWLEEVKSYRSDPDTYMPTAAVDGLIKRDFAPLAKRMRSVTAREQAALVSLAQARRNLSPALTPQVSIDIALAQMPATVDYFKK